MDNITVNDELNQLMLNIRSVVNVYKGGNFILTDDKAPVELLGMREIDMMNSEELGYYKNVYKKEGIGGIIERLV